MIAKILILCLQLVTLAIWGWRRVKHGWRADFTHLPGIRTQQVQHLGASVEVREQCAKSGWPIEALVPFKLDRSWLFELSPQPAIRFSRELEIGMPMFDEKFFIGLESQRFARALAADSALRQHLSVLPSLLARHQAKLVRVACDGNDLAVQANVRWTQDRPALYRGLLVWMQRLGELLEAKSREVPVQRVPGGVGAHPSEGAGLSRESARGVNPLPHPDQRLGASLRQSRRHSKPLANIPSLRDPTSVKPTSQPPPKGCT